MCHSEPSLPAKAGLCTTALPTTDSGRPRHMSTGRVGQSLRATYLPPSPPGHTFPMPQARAGSSRAAGSNRTPEGGEGGGRPPATRSLGSRVPALRPRCRKPAALAGAGCPARRAPAVPVGVREPSRPGIRPPARPQGPAPSRPRARKQRQRGTVEAHGELAALAVVLHADGAALLQRARRGRVRHPASRGWGPRAAAN